MQILRARGDVYRWRLPVAYPAPVAQGDALTATHAYRARGSVLAWRQSAANTPVATTAPRRPQVVEARRRGRVWERVGAYIGQTDVYVNLRPRINITTSAAVAPAYTGETDAIVYVTVRALTGMWTGAGVSPETDETNLRSWLPGQRTPLMNRDGTMSAPWYLFFEYLANKRLGGADGASLPDVVATVVEAQTAASVSAAQATLIAQQGQTNAEVLAATIEVVRNGALPGADSIPQPKLTYLEP